MGCTSIQTRCTSRTPGVHHLGSVVSEIVSTCDWGSFNCFEYESFNSHSTVSIGCTSLYLCTFRISFRNRVRHMRLDGFEQFVNTINILIQIKLPFQFSCNLMTASPSKKGELVYPEFRHFESVVSVIRVSTCERWGLNMGFNTFPMGSLQNFPFPYSCNQ